MLNHSMKYRIYQIITQMEVMNCLLVTDGESIFNSIVRSETTLIDRISAAIGKSASTDFANKMTKRSIKLMSENKEEFIRIANEYILELREYKRELESHQEQYIKDQLKSQQARNN